MTVSTPAEVDIPADQVKTGGNKFGGNDVVIVRDYEAVLRVVDQVVAEIDVRPQQVAIEAMILSVKLNDQNKMGVNWEFLRNKANIRLLAGNPAASLAGVTGGDGAGPQGRLSGSVHSGHSSMPSKPWAKQRSSLHRG